MDKEGLLIHTAFLATKEKLKDRYLFTGKIDQDKTDGNGFFFYLVEILSPLLPSTKIKKMIVEILEKTQLDASVKQSTKIFEDTLLKINDSLGQLAESGESDWVGNLNAVIGFVQEDEINLSQAGTITGYIFRKGKISNMTEKPSLATEDLPLRTFTDITAGNIAENDRIIFGNMELYNHLSLDRLRQMTEKRTAYDAIREMFNSLRKNRLQGVNAIIVEVGNLKILGNEILTDHPETLYLDEPIENFFSILKKRIKPVIYHLSKYSGTLTKQAGFLLQKSKDGWQKNISPKTKAALENSNSPVAKIAGTIRKTVKPKLAEIKKSPYFRHIKVKAVPYTKKFAKQSPLFQKRLLALAGNIYLLLKPNNRKYFYIFLILIFLFMGYNKVKENNVERSKRSQARQISDQYGDAEKAYEKAKDDLALGKAESGMELLDALNLANKSQKNEATKNKANDLIVKIQTSLDQLSKTTRIAGNNPAFSFSGEAKTAVLAGSEIYSINADGKIFVADIRDKEPKLVASIGKEYGTAIDATYSKSPNKIFIYTDKSKVLSYDIAGRTFNELKFENVDSSWEKANSIISYVSNIYLLDSISGQIWKHVERDSGYSDGKAYLDTGNINIKGSVSSAIDGDIYVLQADGTVAKFIKGSLDPSFVLKNIPSPNQKIESGTQIYTDADASSLFVLDKKLNRVIRFDKSGEFANQFVLNGANIDRFVVNSRLQKMWLISKEKVFEVDL